MKLNVISRVDVTLNDDDNIDSGDSWTSKHMSLPLENEACRKNMVNVTYRLRVCSGLVDECSARDVCPVSDKRASLVEQRLVTSHVSTATLV